MANTSAKKLAKANAARLSALRHLILATNVIFGLVRAGLFHSSFRKWHGVVWILFVCIYSAAYWFLWSAATPTYQNGKLVDGGEDISRSGVMEYVHDLIYVAAFVHVLFILSKYALILLLVIPGFAIFKMFSSMKKSQVDEGLDDDQNHIAGLSRKERRQQEREARKR